MTTNNGQRGTGVQVLATGQGVSAGVASGLVLPKGFVPVNIEPPKKRMVINLGGREKSGKTDWPLRTAPEPVYHYALDPNGKFIAQKIARETRREIYTADYLLVRGKDQGEYMRQWQSFLESVYSALSQQEGTLVVDSGTEMWELCRLAHFGKTEQVRERNYGPPNAEIKSLLGTATDSQISTVFIHKLKKEYRAPAAGGEGVWTGGYEFAQWGDMAYSVQANIEAYGDDAAFAGWTGKPFDTNADGTLKPWPFHIYVRDCAPNMTLKGKDFTTDMFTFPTMLNMVFGA